MKRQNSDTSVRWMRLSLWRSPQVTRGVTILVVLEMIKNERLGYLN